MSTQTIIGVVRALNGLLEKVSAQGETHLVKSGAPLHQGDMLTLLSGEAYVQFINGFPEALSLEKPLKLDGISPALKFGALDGNAEIIQEAVAKGIDPSLILDILGATAAGIDTHGSSGEAFYMDPMYGAGLVSAGLDTLPISISNYISDYNPKGIVYVEPGDQSASNTSALPSTNLNTTPIFGSVTESGGSLSNPTVGVPSITGQLSGSGSFTPATFQDAYGKFSMDSTGKWSYDLYNDSAEVNSMQDGETKTVSLTVETSDGIPRQVQITIHGANDAAVIAGAISGDVTESGGFNDSIPGQPEYKGQLFAEDPDNPENTFRAVNDGQTDHGYGTFSINQNGEWVYHLDNNNPAVNSLKAGTNIEDTFTVYSADGTPQEITIVINGTNDITTLSLSASGSVDEGGSITYTATLSHAAQTPVIVTLSNGETITIAAGDTSGTVNVAAPGDDPYLDGSTVSAHITGASGGNFEDLAVDNTAVDTVITDTLDTTTLNLSASGSVAEGGVITYTATLSHAAQTPVTVTLSNGETITIAAGATSGSVDVAAPGDDPYLDGSTVSAHITGASGGNFEDLAVDNTAVDTVITDTLDTTTLNLSASGSVAEGGVITYTATLSHAAQTPVTVTLSNGETITIAAGATSGTVDVAAPGDDPYLDGSTVSAHITGASGGNFEDLAVDNTAVDTVITDTLDTTTLNLSASGSVAEGGVITYTATLSHAAQTPVTVTLSNGETITIAAGATSGTVDVAAPGDDPYLDGSTVSAHITGASGGNFEDLAVDNTAVDTVITDTLDTTTLNLSASGSVAEGGVITYTATLSHAAQTPVTVTLSNGETITIAAGATSGTVDVAAPGDDPYLDGSTVSAHITGASGGNFEDLAVDNTAVDTVITDTLDTTTLNLSASGSVAEGGVITYTATLSHAAQTPVTVTLSNGETITIAAGATSGTVDVAAPGDDPYLDGSTVSAHITGASGGNFEDLAVDNTAVDTVITDTLDTTTLNLSASGSVAEGGVITYTATLSHAAQTPVTVTLSNGETITIAAGATSGSVDVAAPGDDPYLDGSTVSAHITGASGGNFEDLAVDNTAVDTVITDTLDTTTLNLSASGSVAEGGVITYTATLSHAAQTPVTVTLSNGETITIAAGATSGTVDVAAPGDDPYLDGSTVSAHITGASGGNFEDLAVDNTAVDTVITDTLDTTTLSLSASGSVAEGGVITYTATLSHAAQTPVTVTLSNGETITIAAGATSGTVDVAAPGDDPYLDGSTVSAHITGASGGNFEDLAVDNTAVDTVITDTLDTTTLNLSASGSVAEGGVITYTATLSHAAQTPVTVTLSNGETITIAAGATSGTVDVAAPGDDPYLDGSTVSAHITGASGGNFEDLAVDNTAVDTVITDTLDTTTLNLSASGSVAEGGVITYTATLSHAAQTPVTVTLSNGETITIAAGATSGTVDVAAPGDDPYLDGSTVSAHITGASGGNFEDLAVDNTAVDTVITDTLDTTTLNLSASGSVAEGGVITYTATLSHAAQTPVTVTLSNGETITIAAGATSGSVDVAAPGDDPYLDGSTVSAHITGASGGNFEDLAVDNTAVDTVITDTLDTTTLNLSASGSVAEGGVITYTATLSHAAQTPVTVTLSNGETITIAAGATSGTVDVAAPGDDPYLDGSTVSAHITGASGGNFEDLAVDNTAVDTVITDTLDTTTLNLSASGSVAEGGVITYTATLSHAAQTPVTVTLSNGETITIAAGATSGTVDVAAPGDDPYLDGSTVSAHITGASGGNFEDLAVDNTAVDTVITDTLDTTTLNLSASGSVAEGGVITYTATLSHAAQTPVTVTLSNGETITIAAGATSGTVDVAAPGDDPYLDGSTVSAHITGASGGNFEDLAVDNTAVDTVITDTLDTTTLNLSASGSVAEGGVITYTATLSHAAQTPVTVTLSNGETITIAAGATSGTVDVAAPGDDPYLDGSTVSAHITGASGGNFEDLAVDNTAVDTVITDTLDTTTLNLSASGSVAEGGVITYTATLSHAAQTPVTVTLSNGETITIAAGATSGTVDVAAPGDDPYLDGSTVSAHITGASGGNFEDLAVDNTAVDTVITDTLDTTTLNLSASGSVAEGGVITYTATLSHAAQTPVTVTLSNGETITIAAGATSGTVDVAAPGDDPYLDGSTVSAHITGASGGNFEDLAVDNTAVDTVITDTLDTTTLNLSASGSVAEGGVITYTATLSHAAQTPVTVTLSNGETITIAAGATSGTVDVAAPGDDPYLDGSTVSAHITGASGGNFEDLAVDNTAVDTVITDTLDTTTLNLSASGSVAEGGVITYTATLSHAAQTPVTVTLSNGETITIAAGATSGTVDVAAPGDDPYLDGSTVSAHITGASGGNFEDLAVDNTAVDTVITDTLDTTTLNLSASGSVAEGGVITYTATLSHAAQTPVTVTLSNGETITIAAGATSGTVDVAAPGDDPYLDGSTVSAHITGASGGNFEDLAVDNTAVDTVITDTLDTTTLSLSASGSVAEGGVITYTATLSHAAQTPVTVTLSNGETITIAAGATSGTVDVAAPGDDPYLDGSTVSAHITGASGGNFEDLAVDNTAVDTVITDTLDTTTLSLSASGSVAEGGVITYTATLSHAAQTPVTVTLSNGETITIAAGATSGTVDVAAPGDDPYLDGSTVSAHITGASGGNFEDLAVDNTAVDTVITDTLDTTTLSLSASGSVAEGGVITYTATLSHAAQTPVTVTLSNGETITIAAGATSGTVDVAAPGDDPYLDGSTVSAHITGASGGNFEDLAVDNTAVDTVITDTLDTTTLSLSASGSVAEGGVITYTATLSHAAQTPVTVTLSNGETITIAAGATSGTVDVAAPGDDPYLDGSTVSAHITGASGGNFEDLAVNNAAVDTVITDTLDTTTLSLSASGSVAEGGVITYTATLSHAAQTPVTVTLSNGETITIAAGATSGTVDVAAPGDDPYLDGSTVSAHITGASGGNFEDLAVDNTAVDTVITDTIDVSSVILTSNAPATVVQGSTVIYTATVSSPVTDSPLIVELSNGQQIIIAVGETFGNVSSVLTTDASVSILSYSGANYESISTSGTVVTEVNHTPVANNDTISTLEDTPATGNVLTNDTDSDGDSLSVVSFTVAGVSGSFNAGQTVLIANVGTLQINENGDYIFTPVTDYNGSVPVVTYTVTDGSSSSSANLNITVTPVNDGPVAVNDTVNVVVSGVLGRLHSDFYNYREGSDGPNLSSVAMAQNFINNHSPNASFSSTTVNYALNGGNNLGGYVNSSNDNLKTWIGADGSSLVRFDNSPLSTGDAIIHMTGLVNLAAGSYNFRVTADDGYTILIDGVAVATRDLNQSPTTTTFESFNIDTSGLHQIEIVYWDQGGQYVLQVELQKGTDGYHYLGTSDSSGNGVFSLDTLIDVSTLLANDTDVDDPHSSLSIVSVANASHGIVSLDGLGHVVLSVEPGYAGPVTFQYTIQDPHGAQSTATVTVNVEQLTVSIAVSPAGVLEDGSDNLVYTVTLSHPSAFDTTVNYQLSGTATNGTDYTGSAVTGSVIVPAGQLTGTFTIDPTADNLLEANETVIATITSAVSNSVALITAGDPAIGTIINDDTANAVLSVTTHGAEGGSNIVYTVTLSKVNNTGAPITFDIATTGGTATSGSDYTAIPAGAKITVANGSSTGTYTLPVTNDTLPEATETVQATISNSSNASVSIGTASATANITDNDFAPALSLPNVINIVNPGSTSIFTGAGLGTPNGTDQGAGVSQSNLETELSLTSGRLDLFDPPSHGSGSNAYNDPGNVNAIDGKLTNSNYSLQSGDTISFNWSFINGEDSRAEINDGFNDLAVLVVTQPDGTKVLVQISSSEQAEALKTVSGIYNFSATQTGNYQFSWLVLNGGDANKDSRVNITATRVFRGSTEYGDPFALTINAALKVTDGSETLKVRISGVPTVGATFSAGTNLGGGVWEFTTAELVGLIYYPPTTFTSGSIDLTVTAIATETSTGTTASTSQTLTLSVDHTTNTISSGTEGGDSITGTANNDLIHGYAGNDTINAGGGNDLIYGGAGNDTINGQGGNDTIYGGIGNDIISGGDGNDLLFGEAGDDTLNGNAGNDILYGGAGNDILNGGLGNDFLSGGKGNDTLTGGGGIDTFIWMQGDGGTVASKAVDTITDFKANPVGTSADASVLNLSDLLSGEHADTLDSYLSISKTGSDTTISIDPTGHLNPNNIAGTATQTIVLQGVDLTAVFSTTNSHDIINHLIANGNLITDH